MATTTDTTPSDRPKLTLKFLDEELGKTNEQVAAATKSVAGAHKRIDDANDNVNLANTKADGVKRELVGLRYIVGQLQRKGQGTTLANARVATLESELGKITKRLTDIEGKDTSKMDPAALAAFQQESERLNGRLEELFGRVSAEVTTERERLDTLESRVDGHDTAIGAHDTEIGMLKEGQQSLHGRVSIIERLRDNLPKWPLVVGLIAGVIGGFIWEWIPFAQTYPLADGTTKVVPLDAANSIWAAIGAGVGVFVVVTAIALYFAKTKVENEEPQHVAPPAPSYVQTAHSAPAEPDATTKVLVTEGARPGTR